MITQERDVSVVVFGKGDVQVRKAEYDTTNYPYVQLVNCEKTKIGNKPESVLEDSPIVSLVFMNEASLNVLIDKLEECRESFKKEKNSEKAV